VGLKGLGELHQAIMQLLLGGGCGHMEGVSLSPIDVQAKGVGDAGVEECVEKALDIRGDRMLTPFMEVGRGLGAERVLGFQVGVGHLSDFESADVYLPGHAHLTEGMPALVLP